ncbi:MAG TPA: MerR family transcriptional regulator [Trueperaceae bacterium]
MAQPRGVQAEATTRQELLTIGAFSRETRLSLKALRPYDHLGLLTPRRVDEQTGYRYYARDQVEAARLVFLLRQLDMPLNVIAQVLTDDAGAAVRRVESYRREVEDDLAVKRGLVGRVMARLRGEVTMSHEVKVREVPERKFLSIEERTLADGVSEVIRRNADALLEHAHATGVEVVGPLIVIYHGQVSMDADGPVEVCLPVIGAVEPFGRARVRLEPAHAEAYARITKREVEYPKILEAYDSVGAWLHEHGKRGTMSPREVYFAKWDEVGDDDPACDVAFPCE